MSARRYLGIALLGLCTPGAAAAADALLVQKLAPEIRRRCDPGSSMIPARALAEALEASGTVPLTYSSSWRPDPPRAIAAAAFANSGGPNGKSLNRLQRLTQTWIDPSDPSRDNYLPLRAGGVMIVARSGEAVLPAEAEAVLVAILSGDDTRFAFRCTPPAATSVPTPKPPDERWRPRFALSRTPDDLLVDDLEKKAFAEFAYVNDIEANEESYSIHASFGVILGTLTPVRRARTQGGIHLEMWPALFAQYEREGSDSTAEEGTNNLNLGVQLGGYLQARGRRTLSHYYTLTARHLTDDHFDSAAWSLGATFTPDIPLPGNDIAYDLIQDRLRFQWLVTGAVDHTSVSDPGKKSELQTRPEFTRLGFDLGGELRLLQGGDGAIVLSGRYRLREAIGAVLGDARLLHGSLTFRPLQNVSVGFTYDRGKNLDSLEFSEQWRLALGLRW
jgi:hypothetical protein